MMISNIMEVFLRSMMVVPIWPIILCSARPVITLTVVHVIYQRLFIKSLYDHDIHFDPSTTKIKGLRQKLCYWLTAIHVRSYFGKLNSSILIVYSCRFRRVACSSSFLSYFHFHFQLIAEPLLIPDFCHFLLQAWASARVCSAGVPPTHSLTIFS